VESELPARFSRILAKTPVWVFHRAMGYKAYLPLHKCSRPAYYYYWRSGIGKHGFRVVSDFIPNFVKIALVFH